MESPFASKIINGYKLFRRKHGAGSFVPADSTTLISVVVPYAKCKINEIEIVGCDVGDVASLIVKMGEIQLSKFGFDVQMCNGMYRDVSSYDADLVQGLTVVVEYANNSSVDKYIGVNFTLHEMVAIIPAVTPAGDPVIGEQPVHESEPIYVTEEGIPV